MLSDKLEECGRVFSYRDDPDNTCKDVTIYTTISQLIVSDETAFAIHAIMLKHLEENGMSSRMSITTPRLIQGDNLLILLGSTHKRLLLGGQHIHGAK